jgi:tryptophanyl-tRNA synthetase
MTQFKEKAGRSSYVSVGLFTYPVLQAADILLYRAAKVPVGADQVQHLELARRIGRRFNTLVGEEYFPDVEAELTEGKRIMSLADPSQKMSKSLGAKHYVGLMEEPDIVWEKVRAAVTDSGQEIGGQMSPGVANLFELLNLTGAQPDVIQLFTEQHATGNIRYGDLKKAVHENIVQALAPIQQRRFAMSDAAISGILAEGAARASKIARATMVDVRSHVGVGRPQIS